MMPLAILTLLGLWIAGGWGLLHWFSRPRAGELQRLVSDRICGRHEQLTVTLRAVPPINPVTVTPHDVVLLLDRSSSMGAAPGSPFREMLRAAEAFVLRLPQSIHVAVVAFDDTAECVCPFVAEKRRAVRGIGTIAPGGGTSIRGALNKAGELLHTSRQQVERMVVLFSDGFDTFEDVRSAAETLRSHPARPAIYCASFADKRSLPLMTEIAGTADRVFHTEDFKGIVNLFDSLAAEVSGQRALGGLLYEDMRAPCPFRLINAGGSTPVDVHVEESTHVVWPLPQFDSEVTPISYVLEPLCVGWHKVVAGRGSVTWRLPDGSVETRDGYAATRVLVLPAWATWAWPIANPCLMLLISPLLRCRPEATLALAETVPALPAMTMPPALPPPAAPAFRSVVHPAIVVGLGTMGNAVLNMFGDYLWDREIDPDLVSLMAVETGSMEAGDRASPIPPTAHDCRVVSLNVDLWPYLNDQRDQKLPEGRSWLPISNWLAGGSPLTTLRGAPLDRAKVRLCALLHPEPLCAAVTDMLARRGAEDTKIILVGAVEDVDTTGLLAELAHLFAVHGKAATCVLLAAPPGDPGQSGIAAFGDEMSRFLVRRGEPVASDRGGVTEIARQLFDRVLVLDHHSVNSVERARGAMAAIWVLLAQRLVDDRLPPLRGDNVYTVRLSAHVAPQRRLWTWVRERMLSDTLARRWLEHAEAPPGVQLVERADEEVTRQFVEVFWSGEIFGRKAPVLLAQLERVAAGRATGYALVDAGRDYPFNRPYHEQKAFCDRERDAFGRYLESWCAYVFGESAANSRWGIPEVLAAEMAVRAALSGIQEKLRPYAADVNGANLVSFTLSLVLEMRALMSRLIDQIEAWHGVFVTRASSVRYPPARLSVERSIEAALRDAEAHLAADWPSLTTRIEPQYQDWLSRQQPNLLTNLRFRANYKPEQGSMDVELLMFDKSLAAQDDVAHALRTALDQFRYEILEWPVKSWLEEQRPSLPGGRWMGIGLHADEIFGAAVESIDKTDPAVAMAIATDAVTMRDALNCHVAARADDYVWAEEANAERIRGLIKGLLHTDPVRFSPLVISLLRRPAEVLGFLKETASGHVAVEVNSVVLHRGGGRFVLATLADDVPIVSDFEKAVERAVLAGEDQVGRPFPPIETTGEAGPAAEWRTELDRFVTALDNSPIGRTMVEQTEWAMWRDVARGVFLRQVIR